MMMGLLAINNTSDTSPVVLMGITGSYSSQATIMDGFPLAKRGKAARALGAAFNRLSYKANSFGSERNFGLREVTGLSSASADLGSAA